jgi:hypothetical protein
MTERKLERIVEFEPAFDKRNVDPEKNFGIHGVEMRWVLKGERGAVQFLVYTNWQLPHVTQESINRLGFARDFGMEMRCFWLPMAADLGYHSKFPLYEGQEPMGAVDRKFHTDDLKEGLDRFQISATATGTFTPCPYLDGAPCYYDGSGLNAERVLKMLIEKGGEAVWREMEECYLATFEKVCAQ